MLTLVCSASPLGHGTPRVLLYLSFHLLIHHNYLTCTNPGSAVLSRDFSSHLYGVVISAILFILLSYIYKALYILFCGICADVMNRMTKTFLPGVPW